MGLFGADVNLCPSGGDIIICCDGDIELCVECAELTLTGDSDMAVGKIYTAVGGSGDLTFTFDTGTITTTATTCTISTIDSCGASGSSRVGTITVTDSCSTETQTAEIEGRLTGGVWVQTAATSGDVTDWIVENITAGIKVKTYVYYTMVFTPHHPDTCVDWLKSCAAHNTHMGRTAFCGDGPAVWCGDAGGTKKSWMVGSNCGDSLTSIVATKKCDAETSYVTCDGTLCLAKAKQITYAWRCS